MRRSGMPGRVVLASVGCTLIFAVCRLGFPADQQVSKNDVVVRTLDLDVPKGRTDSFKFLWDRFVNKPEEEKFDSVRAKDWKATFKEYREALVQKAKTQSLDEKSLDRCLVEVLGKAKGKKDEDEPNYAFLPVGAYLAKQGGAPVWIIVVRWEFEGYAMKPGGDQHFGHVRVYVLDPKSLEVVGITSCD